MEAAKALGERFEEDVVERLASVAPDDEQKAWGQVNEIRKQLQPILQTTGCVLGNLEVLLEETVVLQPNAGEPERKAVVSVDLVRYRELVKLAHDTGGMDGARGLNRSIGNLITDSVAAIGISVKDTLVSIHGDEATLAFEAPLDAVEFAEQLHLRTDKANENMGMTQAYKYFRIGIALGEVSVTKTIVGERVAGASVLGSTIVDAVQLREACLPGEVVISHDVWAVLPGDRQSTFGPSEEVPGKHPGENTIPAHRRRVVTEK
jgi:class 3 adenylate cyclase